MATGLYTLAAYVLTILAVAITVYFLFSRPTKTGNFVSKMNRIIHDFIFLHKSGAAQEQP